MFLIGSARIDERGRASGGSAGDQKQVLSADGKDYKGEVSMQEFYVDRRGWIILRPNSPTYAIAIASNMIIACNNKYLGYDQGGRYGILKYGVNTKTPTECDCSSLIRDIIKEATGIDPGDFTTANEVAVLMKTGLFSKSEYREGVQLHTGDILVTKTKGHTVCVVAGAARITESLTCYPKCTIATTSIVQGLASIGEKDTSYAHRSVIAKKNGIAGYKGTAAQNTEMLNLLKLGVLKKA